MAGIVDLFHKNLEEMYTVEKKLVENLAELADTTKDEKVKDAFNQHMEETEDHVNKIEEIFGLLDMTPSKKDSHSLAGLEKERDQLMRSNLNKEAMDMVNLNAAIKAERLEISNYENLILLAKELDLDNKEDIIVLLEENLADEESALTKAKSALKSHVPLMKRMLY